MKTEFSALENILKPKSKEQIKNDFFKLYGFHLNDELSLVEKAFKVIQSASNYIITSKMAFYDMIYGFQFESTEPIRDERNYHDREIAEYLFGYWPEGQGHILIFENSGSDTDIESLEDFIRNLNVKKSIDESNIFKPKSKDELELLIPPEARKLITDLYKLIDNLKTYEIITYSNSIDGMHFYNDGWGFGFKSINRISVTFGLTYVKQIGRFNIKFLPRHNEIFIKLENNDIFGILKNKQNLKDFLWSRESITVSKMYEAMGDVLKPKSEDEIKEAFEKEYPIFTKIFYEMFPNSNYNLNVKDDNVSASFAFKETKDKKEFMFIVNQLPYIGFKTAPSISYLDKSVGRGEFGGVEFGGVFTNAKKVYNIEDIRNYVDKIVN